MAGSGQPARESDPVGIDAIRRGAAPPADCDHERFDVASVAGKADATCRMPDRAGSSRRMRLPTRLGRGASASAPVGRLQRRMHIDTRSQRGSRDGALRDVLSVETRIAPYLRVSCKKIKHPRFDDAWGIPVDSSPPPPRRQCHVESAMRLLSLTYQRHALHWCGIVAHGVGNKRSFSKVGEQLDIEMQIILIYIRDPDCFAHSLTHRR